MWLQKTAAFSNPTSEKDDGTEDGNTITVSIDSYLCAEHSESEQEELNSVFF